MIVFIFGDSITQGYWDARGGWADRLKASVMKRDIESGFANYHGIHNLGIDGNLTRQVIERFDNETSVRFWPNSKYGVIFAIGVNDTLHRGENDFESTPEKYREELSSLLDKANKFASDIAFVNLTPVDEELTNPLPSSTTGKCYTNKRIDQFNAVLSDFCKLNQVTLIDVHSKFAGQEKELLADGTHPNAEGHSVIEEAVAPVLNSWLNH